MSVGVGVGRDVGDGGVSVGSGVGGGVVAIGVGGVTVGSDIVVGVISGSTSPTSTHPQVQTTIKKINPNNKRFILHYYFISI